MRSLVRLVMLWILIVSLPVQGIAASVKSPCTMSHAAAVSQVEVRDDCDEAGMAMATAHASKVAAHQDMPCDQGAHQKHSTCPACSACSVGASAPPPFEISVPPVEHFANDYISPSSSITGWIPSRIERPPRL
jgi:hypothetical protein